MEKGFNQIPPNAGAKLSLRIPPKVDPDRVAAALEEMCTKDAPLKATVKFTQLPPFGMQGWAPPALVFFFFIVDTNKYKIAKKK